MCPEDLPVSQLIRRVLRVDIIIRQHCWETEHPPRVRHDGPRSVARRFECCMLAPCPCALPARNQFAESLCNRWCAWRQHQMCRVRGWRRIDCNFICSSGTPGIEEAMLFLNYVVTTKLLFHAYSPPFFLALLTRINIPLLFCPKESLLTAKWKPTIEANTPAATIASQIL